LAIITTFLRDDEISTIRETYQAIDVDNSGEIDSEELVKAYLAV
jgi:Ca2+-binding EF-hand superfamily protein